MSTTTTRPRRPKSPPPTPPDPTRDAPVTVGDLLQRLGNIPARRVLLHPTPGTATEADLLRVLDSNERLCELIEGTLVEKPVSFQEALLTTALITELYTFVRRRKLGCVTTPDMPFRLFAGLVRLPDIAFTSYERMPGRKIPKAPIPEIAPDLAVEILSKSNTASEIRRKLGEYFSAGVRLAWIVDPRKKAVRVHTSAIQSVLLREGDTLDGADVLPGFRLPVAKLFEEEDAG